MGDLHSTLNFRAMLFGELNRRIAKNPKYSSRHFARDLRIPPTVMWDILNGRKGISYARATKISERLNISAAKKALFLDLVAVECSRSKSAKLAALERIRSKRGMPEFHFVPTSDLGPLSKWYHFVLLELSRRSDFQEDLEWIAQRIGIHPFEAESALKVLKEAQLIKVKNGKPSASFGHVRTSSDIPSAAIQKAHCELLAKAARAVQSQPIEQREFTAGFVLLNPVHMLEAKESIRKFQTEFVAKYGSTLESQEVYCLGVQLFKLSKEP